MNKVFDRLMLISILFLIFVLWITYLTKNPLIAIIVSIMLCLVIGIIIRPRKKRTAIHVDAYLPKLSAMTNKQLSEMIIKVLSKEINPKISPQGLISAKDKMLILPMVKMREITPDEICKLSESAKRLCYKKLILVVNSYDKVGYAKIRPYLSVDVEFLGIDKILALLEKSNELPEIQSQKAKRQKLVTFFHSATKRKNGKYFLLTGISMAFLSIFTPLTLYYLIFSSFMLITSMCCYLKKKEITPSILKC